MATYNGRKYLDSQLKSILNQSFSEFDLYISDDGSTDGTNQILKGYEKLDERVHVLKINNKSCGPLQNFKGLINYVSSKNYKYIMFSDQDDIWYKDKIKSTLVFMKCNENGPTLIYTNYKENDFRGKINPKYNDGFPLNKYPILLYQNWIMGCTMMINSSLLSLSKDIPDEADNHDNWIVLVALTYGRIVYFSKTTMFHRVHTSNVTNNFKNRGLIHKGNKFIKDVVNGGSFRFRKKQLCKKILSLPVISRTNYVESFYDCLDIDSKFKRMMVLKEINIKGLNYHKTMKLFLMI
jgi:rhamnosyltransferase